jgi:hypothetical protein
MHKQSVTLTRRCTVGISGEAAAVLMATNRAERNFSEKSP